MDFGVGIAYDTSGTLQLGVITCLQFFTQEGSRRIANFIWQIAQWVGKIRNQRYTRKSCNYSGNGHRIIDKNSR